MVQLRNYSGSSTKAQHTALVASAAKKGMSVDDVRTLVGGSIRKLSAKACSEWIQRISGDGLPNPPGSKPGAQRSEYQGRAAPGVTRIISEAQCDQIMRLAVSYFEGSEEAATAWLKKNFDVSSPRELGTAQRGGEVIAVLKRMHVRREKKIV